MKSILIRDEKMKVRTLFFCAFSFILTVLSCTGKNPQTTGDSFEALKAAFPEPPMSFRTVPFWVWHDAVTCEEIDRQLEDFKEKGFGGVFIHPRYGLVTEYLSQEWFDRIGDAVKKAETLGLEVWLYDENSFPSGFGGGHVPAQMPESYNQGQGLILLKRGYITADSFHSSELVLKKEGDAFIEILKPPQKDMREDGQFYVFEKKVYERSKWYGGYSYVDLLLEGVTEKFIDVTMDGYEKTAGHVFGKTIPGIFTDEPHINPPGGRNSIRWTPGIFELFRRRWGYDLKPLLAALFEETGDWKRVRHNYQTLLLERFIERWAKPWYRYCEDKHWIWTGHYWEHEWPNPRNGPDNMAMYAWHQMPGIDMLFNSLEERPDQFGNIQAVKELSSVANQMGRTRTLSETYGAAGWELTFEDMKRLGDWEYVLGVNFMNQHLSYMTLKGDRKHDFPQSFSYHTPWWDLYTPVAGYFARLSLALSSGEQRNRILVLEPTTTTWMYFGVNGRNEQLENIKDAFKNLLDVLERYHVEYDLGSENIIGEQGSVKEKEFTVGKRSYDIVILPPFVETLDKKTGQLLELFMEKRGKIISFSDPPSRIDGKENNRFAGAVQRHSDLWLKVSLPVPQPVIDELRSHSPAAEFPPDMGGKLFHQRRYFKDGNLLFLANFSAEENSRGWITLAGSSVTLLNPFTGSIEPYACEQKDGKIRSRIDIPPCGSLLLFIHQTGKNKVVFQPELMERLIPASGEMKIERLEPNVATLDYCDLKLEDKWLKGMYFYTASDTIFKHHGFADNPWVSSTQYKTDILDLDRFPENSGFEARFPFHIEAGTENLPLLAVIERPGIWKVLFNGEILEPLKDRWWLDRSFGVFELKGVHTGENAITLKVNPMSVHAELEPVYLLGDFSVKDRNGWRLDKPDKLTTGSWREKGMPFYGHTVSYKCTFNLNTDQKVAVRLGKWKGTVAEVRVNRERAGIIAWSPYELDITPVQQGEQEIEVIVYGSLKNVLGPHHNVTHRGIVTPWSFKFAPEHQPKGADYDLLDYGLFEPFLLVEKF